jgi:hypothetical protein
VQVTPQPPQSAASDPRSAQYGSPSGVPQQLRPLGQQIVVVSPPFSIAQQLSAAPQHD